MKKLLSLVLASIILLVLAWTPSGIYHYTKRVPTVEVERLQIVNVEVIKYDTVFTVPRGTTYQPVVAQCNADPLHTANMTKVDLSKLKTGEQKLCAFSYDIKAKYNLKFGDKFEIYTAKGDFLGTYTFCDHMNRRIKNTCDMMIHPEATPDLYKNIVIKKVAML